MNVPFRGAYGFLAALVMALASTGVVNAAEPPAVPAALQLAGNTTAVTPAVGTSPSVPPVPHAPKDLSFWHWEDWAKLPERVRHFGPFADTALASTVAVADLGTDGIDEIVVGTGFGVAPRVRVLRGDGTEILSFSPFDEFMQQGVVVAVGDLDGDGRAEIVAGTGPGAPTRIKVFDVAGNEKAFPVTAPFVEDFTGGVSLAVADTDGDGKADIVAAAGVTGGPHVRVWNHQGILLSEFFAFGHDKTQGVNVAAGDMDGDGKAEVVAALKRDAESQVRVFSGVGVGAPHKVGEFVAIPGGFRGGLNLTVSDLNGDNQNEIVAAPNGGGGPHVHAFGRLATATGVEYRLLGHFFAYDDAYFGGVLLASGTFKAGEKPSLVTVPAERTVDGRPDLAQYINVDLSEQRMRIFEYGRLVRTMLVATGKVGFDTPQGDFKILEKPLMVNYRWNYGPGNPENYDMGWVKWNMRFYPHIYIHNAPWRKTFGVRGSHGCVNLSPANAEWVYNWSKVGTPITVQK